MNDINNKIEQAISEHLPEQTAKEMRKFIEKYDELKGANSALLAKMDKMDDSIRRRDEKIKYIEEQNSILNNVISEGAETVKRAEELETTSKEELEKLRAEKLMFKNETLQKSLENMQDFMINMSRSPVYKKSIHESNSVDSWKDGHNTPSGWQDGYNKRDTTEYSKTETTETE